MVVARKAASVPGRDAAPLAADQVPRPSESPQQRVVTSAAVCGPQAWRQRPCAWRQPPPAARAATAANVRIAPDSTTNRPTASVFAQASMARATVSASTGR